MLDTFVESGVGGHIDNATQAWVFGLDNWGICGQGDNEASALADLARRTGIASLHVIERIVGDELAFERDRMPATQAQHRRTQEILDTCRAETIELIESATDPDLDFDDTDRLLPPWATWRTPRQLARHIADTETRYYLASLMRYSSATVGSWRQARSTMSSPPTHCRASMASPLRSTVGTAATPPAAPELT